MADILIFLIPIIIGFAVVIIIINRLPNLNYTNEHLDYEAPKPPKKPKEDTRFRLVWMHESGFWVITFQQRYLYMVGDTVMSTKELHNADKLKDPNEFNAQIWAGKYKTLYTEQQLHRGTKGITLLLVILLLASCGTKEHEYRYRVCLNLNTGVYSHIYLHNRQQLGDTIRYGYCDYVVKEE